MARSCLTLLALVVLASTLPAQFLPNGFADEVVITGIAQPVGMGFAPDGRFFVTGQKSFQIWCCLTDGTKTMIGTVTGGNGGGSERGLLGVAVDPGFPANPYIYVQYSRSGGGMTAARYTVSATSGSLGDPMNTNLAISNRFFLVTGLPDVNFNHNGGTVRFGTDGMLYASFGDDDGSHCAAAQTIGNGRGEIFRMDVSNLPPGAGGPPSIASLAAAGNPSWAGQQTGPWAPLVWAMGLRNPFRFNIDATGPNATNNLYIADVGEFTWEELDEAPFSLPGRNFGAPWREGNAPWLTCSFPQPPLTPPIAVQSHSTGVGAVVSMPRYRNVAGGTFNFGPSYEGDLFYLDYFLGGIYRLTRNGTSWVQAPAVPGQPSPTFWGSGFSAACDFVLGPDGAIYYVRQSSPNGTGSGTVHRIKSNANQPQVFVVSGNNQIGTQGRMLAQPLVVSVTLQGTPQAGVTVTFTPNSGSVSPSQAVTDASGMAQTFFTLDAASALSPTVTASVPGGVSALFTAVWRGLTIAYVPGANLAIVTFRHSQGGAPVSIGFDAPHPSPVATSPFGSLWLDVFTPSPFFGVIVDGLGLFGPPTPNSATTSTGVFSRIFTGLPSFGGLQLDFQGFGVDTSLFPAANAIIVSGKVSLTLQ